MGKKVSTSNRGLAVKDYTPSMKVPTSSRDMNFPWMSRATYSSLLVFHTSK